VASAAAAIHPDYSNSRLTNRCNSFPVITSPYPLSSPSPVSSLLFFRCLRRRFTRPVFRNGVPLAGNDHSLTEGSGDEGSVAKAKAKIKSKKTKTKDTKAKPLSGDIPATQPAAKRAKQSRTIALDGRAADLKALVSILLSGECATQPTSDASNSGVCDSSCGGATIEPVMKFADIIHVMRANVPNVDTLLDRLGQVPVSKYVVFKLLFPAVLFLLPFDGPCFMSC